MRIVCGKCETGTEWAKAGVFDALHLKVLDRVGEQGRLDGSRASVGTMSVRARRRSYRGQVGGVRGVGCAKSDVAFELPVRSTIARYGDAPADSSRRLSACCRSSPT